LNKIQIATFKTQYQHQVTAKIKFDAHKRFTSICCSIKPHWTATIGTVNYNQNEVKSLIIFSINGNAG
jgi:hypothetical protein